MVKKLCSALVMLIFIISSFGCLVAPAPRHAPPPKKQMRMKARQPGPEYFWVNGHWEWKKGRYVWRNGYWKKNKRNRRWVSGHWRETGNGWVWIKGHWR